MSKRNGRPKPSASERTRYRFRMRHDIETPEDTKRFNFFQKIKERIHPRTEET